MSKYMHECETEEERQALRDYYAEATYHQTVIQNGKLANIQERLRKIEDKLDLLARRQIESQFLKEITYDGRAEV